MVFIWIKITIRSLPACLHKSKNVLIFSAGWNWRLWSTLESDFAIIKVKIKLKDRWAVLKTLSIIPLGQAVSTVMEQFDFFLMARSRVGREMIQIIHLLTFPFNGRMAFKGNAHISSWLKALETPKWSTRILR